MGRGGGGYYDATVGGCGPDDEVLSSLGTVLPKCRVEILQGTLVRANTRKLERGGSSTRSLHGFERHDSAFLVRIMRARGVAKKTVESAGAELPGSLDEDTRFRKVPGTS